LSTPGQVTYLFLFFSWELCLEYMNNYFLFTGKLSLPKETITGLGKWQRKIRLGLHPSPRDWVCSIKKSIRTSIGPTKSDWDGLELTLYIWAWSLNPISPAHVVGLSPTQTYGRVGHNPFFLRKKCYVLILKACLSNTILRHFQCL
jgi:hypothetical protein